ncbi:DivIVA domain-containing protein [candidate division KSB1 bacterium]|nr:DivIVA domain-containing protein [candidate division KSB1 bacterium]
MKITPLDIKKQEFKRGFRGYDPQEVDAFLEMLAEEYEILIRERNHFSDDVLKLKTQLKDYQDVERTFKESLMKAQKTIDDSRENAKHEADLIIRDAELKAEKILENTRIQLAEMKNELMLVRSQKESFAKRLRHLLESQLELIGVLEIDDLGLGQFEEKAQPAPSRPAPKAPEKRSKLEFKAVDDEDDENVALHATAPSASDYHYPHDDLKNSDPVPAEAPEPVPFIQKPDVTADGRRRVRLSDQFIIQ